MRVGKEVVHNGLSVCLQRPNSQGDDIKRWGVFGTELDHEGGILMNGINALGKGTSPLSLRALLFLPSESTVRSCQSAAWQRAPAGT